MSKLAASLRSPGPEDDLAALLARMRQRWYPESTRVLASFWLRTVCAAGHKHTWWREMNGLIQRTLRQQLLEVPGRQALEGILNWIRQAGLLEGHAPEEAAAEPIQPYRADLRPAQLTAYVARLLNDWLPAEIERMLAEESEHANPEDAGRPVLVGRALGRLLDREHLSPRTLEMLLQPASISPRDICPANAEILQDVALALLGRTSAPPPSALPATLVALASRSPMAPDYREAVARARLLRWQGSEQVSVPISPAQALRILQSDPIRIASIIVTMDGRWWESQSLQSGEQHSIVYKPGGRLWIDHSASPARLDLPWPETELRWPGAVHLCGRFEIFGRQWRTASWETDGKRTRLHLLCSGPLPLAAVQPAAGSSLRRSRPAAVDMAWTAMENAIAAAISRKTAAPIDQLRRPELIPLGRAIFALARSVRLGWLPMRQVLEPELQAIRSAHAGVAAAYGPIPWRVLPPPVQAALLKHHPPGSPEWLGQVFVALPAGLSSPPRAA